MSQNQDSAGQPDLVQVLSTAAEQVAGSREATEAQTVAWIVTSAVDTVPGAEYAGVSLLRPDGEIISQAVSHDAQEVSHDAVAAIDTAHDLSRGPVRDGAGPGVRSHARPRFEVDHQPRRERSAWHGFSCGSRISEPGQLRVQSRHRQHLRCRGPVRPGTAARSRSGYNVAGRKYCHSQYLNDEPHGAAVSMNGRKDSSWTKGSSAVGASLQEYTTATCRVYWSK